MIMVLGRVKFLLEREFLLGEFFFIADVSEVYSLIEFLTSRSASMMTGCMVPIDAGEGKAI